MKHTFHENKWTWYELEEATTEDFDRIASEVPGCERLLEDIKNKNSNFLKINTETKGKEYVWGSLIYKQNINKRTEKSVFHFCISKDFFLTVGFNFDELPQTDSKSVLKQMEGALDGIEGFFVLLGEILTNYLYKIDGYEERFHDLLWKMKEQNNREILEEIYESRHELLTWKNLMVPITEMKYIAEEAYGSEIRNKAEFSRVATRLDRARALLADYQQEIDTMINLEEVVSSHRGNEIMKTLTVITVLFTPVMGWGALWGMNFKFMPELDWKFGYGVAVVLILISTVGLYFYLRMKGWIGDILNSKKKGTFFK